MRVGLVLQTCDELTIKAIVAVSCWDWGDKQGPLSLLPIYSPPKEELQLISYFGRNESLWPRSRYAPDNVIVGGKC